MLTHESIDFLGLRPGIFRDIMRAIPNIGTLKIESINGQKLFRSAGPPLRFTRELVESHTHRQRRSALRDAPEPPETSKMLKCSEVNLAFECFQEQTGTRAPGRGWSSRGAAAGLESRFSPVGARMMLVQLAKHKTMK